MIIKLMEGTPEEYEAQLKKVRFVLVFAVWSPLIALAFFYDDGLLVTIRKKYHRLVTMIKRYKQRSLISRRPVEAQYLHIRKAPGSYLLKFVDFFYSQKTVENTFMPLVADWRTEHFEALKQGRKWKVQWIDIRYRYSFMQAMGLGVILLFIKFLKGP